MFATHRLRTLFAALFAAAAILVPSSLLAQASTQGTIVITVQDARGGLVPRANLTLVNHSTNDTRVAESTSNGSYTFVNLPIGTYTLTIARSGYQTKVYSDVLVQASQSTAV